MIWRGCIRIFDMIWYLSPVFLICTLFSNFLKKVLISSNMTCDNSKSVPVVSAKTEQIRSEFLFFFPWVRFTSNIQIHLSRIVNIALIWWSMEGASWRTPMFFTLLMWNVLCNSIPIIFLDFSENKGLYWGAELWSQFFTFTPPIDVCFNHCLSQFFLINE